MIWKKETNTLYSTPEELVRLAGLDCSPSHLSFQPVLHPSQPSLDGYATDISLQITEHSFAFPIQISTTAPAIETYLSTGRIYFYYEKKKPSSAHPTKDVPLLYSCLITSYLACVEYNILELTLTFDYASSKEGSHKRFEALITRDDLRSIFFSSMEKAYPFFRLYHDHETKTLPSLDTLRFPYGTPREGQKEFMVSVLRSIHKKQRLLASAPTGIGKTMGVLFPALKALSKKDTDKIFYLTAKTVTGKAASDAMSELAKQVSSLRSITIYAKERFCPMRRQNATSACFVCPSISSRDGVSYQSRERNAILEVLNNKRIIDNETLLYYANQFQVCPYELSLDLSEWCDVIICDYNYLLDDQVRFTRYFGDHPIIHHPTILFDEAHNLPDRARTIYSAELTSNYLGDALSQYQILRSEDKEYLSHIQKLLDYVKTIAASSADQTGEDDSDIKYSFSASADYPSLLPSLLSQWMELTRKRLFSCQDEVLAPVLGRIYSDLKKLLLILSYFDEHYRFYVSVIGDSIELHFLCLDPSKLMDYHLSQTRSCIFFSATLSPLLYYADIFGSPDASLLDLPSPYPKENLCLVCADYISTRFADRGHTAEEIAEAILAMIEEKEGHYLAYFSSYKFMKSVGRILVHRSPEYHYVIQQKNMTLSERQRFIKEFDTLPKKGETTLGLCVLGGIFSEGIDLKGDALIGVAVVGIGLGSLNSESNLLQEYFENTRESGKEYAYIYPGMNRILQAAGRVIRDENDKGVVLLIDDRYDDPGLQKLFPPHWQDMKFVGNTESLSKVVHHFWSFSAEKEKKS